VSIAVGLLLGAGILLVVSPLLWPTTQDAASRSSGSIGTAMNAMLSQAGVPRVRPATLVVVSLMVAAAASAVTYALLPVSALALAVGLVAGAIPAIVISLRARARRRATRVLWPDVVDQLVSAVRSGQSLPDSIATLAHSGPVATREPFARFETDYRTTGNFGLCVTDLKATLADPVADRILETIRMSRDVGGSELTTVLRNLAAYLRQEAAIRSEVEARQSWVVNAARLGVAAPWIVLLLLATRPEAAAAYNTAAGAVLIVGGLGVSVIAYRLMIAIGRIPEERRWFQ
jgi:tight adherence protein B